MSVMKERDVARSHGIDPNRCLPRTAADFYLLETMTALGVPGAGGMLGALEDELAPEFASYLNLAIGGELRYARDYIPAEEIPVELRPFTKALSGSDRGYAWWCWFNVGKVLGPKALELAEVTFDTGTWNRNFGGEPWAGITRLLRRYLGLEIPARVFVDQVFNAEHNSGLVLNKVYDTGNLPPVLWAHGEDNYATLCASASVEVASMWRAHQWRKRREHDPVWLGVQILDSYPDSLAQGA